MNLFFTTIRLLFFFVAIPLIVFSQSKAIIVKQNASELIIDYYPTVYTSEKVYIQSKPFLYFRESELVKLNPGEVVLPKESFSLGIPASGSISIEVLSSEYETLNDVAIAPQPNIIKSKGTDEKIIRDFNNLLATSNLVSPTEELISYQREDWFRYQKIRRIEIYPFQYNANSRILKQYRYLQLKITFQNIPAVSQKVIADPHFEDVYKTLIINYEQAKNWRANPNTYSLSSSKLTMRTLDSTGIWFDPSKKYARISVLTDGLYKLRYEDLVSKGIISGPVSSQAINLFYKGYSVPLRVLNDTNNIFESGCSLEFFGTRLYDAPEIANEFSDTSIYWLTFEGSGGNRIQSDSATIPNLVSNITAYTHRIKTEKDSIYYFGDGGIIQLNRSDKAVGEGWYWKSFYVDNKTYSYGFQANDVNRIDIINGRLTIRLHSAVTNRNDSTHNIFITLNGNYLGNIVFGSNADTVASLLIPNSMIKEGVNSLSLKSLLTSTTINEVMFDWFTIEYPRLLKARGDSIFFSINDTLVGKVAQFQITSFTTSNISVYRLNSNGNIEKAIIAKIIQSGSTFDAVFADTCLSGRSYYVVSETKKRTPINFQLKTFLNLRSYSFGADYLIVTNRLFSSAAQRLADYRRQKGMRRTYISFVDDIYDECNFGHFDPLAIRKFLIAIDTLWQSPKPSFVVLMGDANWDYKDNYKKGKQNFVPSIGIPVSDNWLVATKNDRFLAEKAVGRIPCATQSEAEGFVSNLISYEATPLNLWNKRYMFMASGWDSVETLGFQSFWERIISQYIFPAPLAGIPKRFYKTVSQITEFQKTEEIKRLLGDGAVWISFLGHGGSDMWGNGITEPQQLINNELKRHIVSDVSCGTARFAEPLVTSFAEKLVIYENGGAMGFIGSSAFGFEGTLTFLAEQMWKFTAQDTLRELGKILQAAKTVLWAQGTSSIINQESLDQYTLVGDPATILAVPKLADYAVSQDQVSINPFRPLETDTNITIIANLLNYGLQGRDSILLRINHTPPRRTPVIQELRIRPIGSIDTIIVKSSKFNEVGAHNIEFIIDPLDITNELTKANNNTRVTFIVSSNRLLPIRPIASSVLHPDSVILEMQNPGTLFTSGFISQFEIDTSVSFINPIKANVQMGSVTTKWKVPPSIFSDSALYYWRGRYVGTNDSTEWVNGFFLTNQNSQAQWGQDRGTLFQSNSLQNVMINNGVKLRSYRLPVEVQSAGFSDGSYAKLIVNGENLSVGAANRGYNIAVMDSKTGIVESISAFSIYSDIADTMMAEPLIQFLNQIPFGKRVLIGIADEGSKNKTERLNKAIETMGSALIRSVGWRQSWAIIGWKGAPKGSVKEMRKSVGQGPIILQDTLNILATDGKMISPSIGPVAEWKGVHITVDTSIPGSKFWLDIIRVYRNGNRDTIFNFIPSQQSEQLYLKKDISSIQLIAELNADSTHHSPILRQWSVQYIEPPELALSPLLVELSKEKVLEGEPITISGKIYNLSKTNAESVLVKIGYGKSVQTSVISQTVIPMIQADSFGMFYHEISSIGKVGQGFFSVEVNPENTILERFSGNNTISIPILVIGDTVPPVLDITFDGRRIFENDYVQAKPTIRILVKDNSPMQIIDPGNFIIKLNGQRINLGSSPDSQFVPASGNGTAIAIIRPELTKGKHTLSVQVKDASENFADTTESSIQFQVQMDANIERVFNYPNPFHSFTYFTFIITGAKPPDQARIKIYSISGRLINELEIPVNQLQIGRNSIRWEARDKDGDTIANGIYFYKIVTYQDGKTIEAIQKLAKVQ